MANTANHQQALLEAELANLAFNSTKQVRRAAFEEDRPRRQKVTFHKALDGTPGPVGRQGSYVSHSGFGHDTFFDTAFTFPATTGSAAAPGGFVQPKLYQPGRKPVNEFLSSQSLPRRHRGGKKKTTSPSPALPAPSAPPASRFYGKDGKFRLKSSQQPRKRVGPPGSAPPEPYPSLAQPNAPRPGLAKSKHAPSEIGQPSTAWQYGVESDESIFKPQK